MGTDKISRSSDSFAADGSNSGGEFAAKGDG